MDDSAITYDEIIEEETTAVTREQINAKNAQLRPGLIVIRRS